MPGRMLQTAAAVVILGVSVPVFSFAVFTSVLALFLASIRASFIQLPFWLSVLWESRNEPWEEEKATVSKRPTVLTQPPEFRTPMLRSRTSSFVDTASLKRSSYYRSDSHSSLVGTPINRDFEGIGGWRTSQEYDDNSLWLNMKSRMDRDSRIQRRPVTPGSIQSPEAFPMPMRTPRTRPATSGSASPQSYFSIQLPTSKSMVSLQGIKRFSGTSADFTNQELGKQDTDQIGVAF